MDCKKIESVEFQRILFQKQMTGIEPASSAWEADVLPMNYICMSDIITQLFLKGNPYFYDFSKFTHRSV